MTLRTNAHANQGQVDDEFRNLDRDKEDAWVWNASRAPNASDKGKRKWVFRDGAVLREYTFDSVAGVWRGPVNFS